MGENLSAFANSNIVPNTRDVITFKRKYVAEIKKAFHESISDYLGFCKERMKNQISCFPENSI